MGFHLSKAQPEGQFLVARLSGPRGPLQSGVNLPRRNSPDIVVAILNGRQPVVLTASKLMADTRLPLSWDAQRKALGFA